MILKLALADLKCDRLMSVCAAAAMTAVIAPLLLLFSLRYGIITSLENNLRNSPANLEIKMLSGYDLDEGFFRQMRADPDVGFVVEVTRALSLTSDIMGRGKVKTMVDTVPTAKGDPLFAFSKIPDLKDDGECAVTEQLASDIGVAKGGTIKVAISRTVGGVRQSAAKTFTVAGVVKNAAAPGYHAYLTLPVITAMEDWRDGYEPLIFSDGSKPNAQRKTFSKARIYASSIDTLESLSKKLRARFNISDRTSEIDNIRAVAGVLNFIFLTVALVSIAGGAVALGGLILSSASRKAKSYSMLRLIGLPGSGVCALIVIENLILGACAFCLSLALYAAGAFAFNTHFASAVSDGAVICSLTPMHLACALLLCEGLCVILALAAVRLRVLSFTPAAALREL
jgi:putative ABC transport system permease protein